MRRAAMIATRFKSAAAEIEAIVVIRRCCGNVAVEVLLGQFFGAKILKAWRRRCRPKVLWVPKSLDSFSTPFAARLPFLVDLCSHDTLEFSLHSHHLLLGTRI